MIPIPVEVMKTAFEFLKRSPGVVQKFSPKASGALDKLIGLFNPETIKIAGGEASSATLTSGNSAAVAGAKQLLPDSKSLQDCLTSLYGHVSSDDWTSLNKLFGLMHEAGVPLESGELKTLHEYFSKLKQDPLAIITGAGVEGTAVEEVAAGVVQDDTGTVLNNLLDILSAKVCRPDSHFYNLSKLLKTFGVTSVPGPEELPQWLEKNIVTDDFKQCLRACIEGKEPEQKLLNGFWQNKAFSVCKGLLNNARDNPDLILQGGPQASYYLRYTAGPIMGFLSRLPVVGWLAAWLFPFAVDLVGSTGEKGVNDKLKSIIGILQKNKPANPQAPTTILNPAT